MRSWLWWVPLGALVVLGAAQAFRLGWIAAHLTETDAIAVYAARYVAQAGPAARETDCVAMPGQDVWLVLRCGRDGKYRGYWINRFGGLEREAGPGPWDALSPRPKEPRT